MRIETDASRSGVERARASCWLTTEECEQLAREADDWAHSMAIKTQYRCGPRSFELTQLKPKHVSRSEDGEHYTIRIPRGKDTTGSGGKARDAYLPEDVERDLHRYATERDIGDDEHYFPVSKRTIQRWVKRAAQNVGGYRVDEDGNEHWDDEDWKHVSSHDLRRHFAQQLLVNERMNPRVVMAVGGWTDFESLKPYLNAPTNDVIFEEFDKVDW